MPRNSLVHGTTRYLIFDNTTVKKGFITSQLQYTKAAYLNTTATNASVTVRTLQSVTACDNINRGKAIKELPVGIVINNAIVVRANSENDAMDHTKVETLVPNNDFFIVNADYVEIATLQANSNTGNNSSNSFAFGLQSVSLYNGYNNSQY